MTPPDTMTSSPKFDYSEFAVPAPEWQAIMEQDVLEEGGSALLLPHDKAARDLRAEQDAERRERAHPRPKAQSLDDGDVTMEQTEIHDGPTPQDRLTARVYTRKPREDDLPIDKVPGVVYYHRGGGGGDTYGTEGTQRDMCGLLASRLRVVAVQICYRQAPRHPHAGAGAQDDGKDGFEWVVRNAERLGIDPGQIVVVGLSCGAGIAASTTLRVCNEDAEEAEAEAEAGPPQGKRKRTDCDGRAALEEKATNRLGHDELPPKDKVFDRFTPIAGKPQRRIKGLLLILPWLLQESAFPYDLFSSPDVTSRVQCGNAPFISEAVNDSLVEMLGAEDPLDPPPWNVPLAKDEELARFPRTALMVSGMDFFRDDALILAEKLRKLG
jgi:acetyl esterase/lipase